jgi:cytoskeleton-associated protein 5
MLDDSSESVRNEAALALGSLMKIVGERAMNPIMEPLDDLRKAKVKEAFEKVTVKCKAGSGAPASKPPPAPTDSAPPKKKGAPPTKRVENVQEDEKPAPVAKPAPRGPVRILF